MLSPGTDVLHFRQLTFNPPRSATTASWTSTPLSGRNVHRQFKKGLIATGLPDVRPHDLRRSAASLLAPMGVHQRTAMETLAHSTSAMTIDVYTDVMPGQLEETAACMGSLLAPAPPDPSIEGAGDSLGS